MHSLSDGVTNGSTLKDFLEKHPLTTRWLDDIINVLLDEPRGTAHIARIAKRLWGERYVSSIEQTITRRINDFCSDAADFHKTKQFDFFQRVEPATYRLRSFPDVPDTLELVTVEFDDTAMQSTWEFFARAANKKFPEKWETYSNRQRLTAFVNWPGRDENYQRTRDVFALD